MIRVVAILFCGLIGPPLALLAFALTNPADALRHYVAEGTKATPAEEWIRKPLFQGAKALPRSLAEIDLPDKEKFAHRLAQGTLYVADSAARGIVALFAAIAFGLVGLFRGMASRKRLLASFGFSSPACFLLAKGFLFLALVSLWGLCFLPLGSEVSVLCSIACGIVLSASHLLAKHFPVVW